MKLAAMFALPALVALGQASIPSLTAQIQKTPTASLYADRGAAYLSAGDPKNALSDFDRALDRDALSLRAITLRAQANTRLGRHADAITDYSGAIALSPADAQLYLSRAASYAAAGDAAHAEADRKEAIRLDPKAASAPAPVVNAAPPPEPVQIASVEPVKIPAATPPPAPASKSPAPPKPAAQPPKVTPPPAPEAAAPPNGNANDRYQRAKSLLDRGQTSNGIAELNEAIRLNPRNAVYYNTRGYAHYLSRDYKSAIKDYDEAIRLNPDYLNATHNRAIARRAIGDNDGYNADRQREIDLGKKQGVRVP